MGTPKATSQHAVLLQPIIETTISQELRGMIKRLVLFLSRNAYEAGWTRRLAREAVKPRVTQQKRPRTDFLPKTMNCMSKRTNDLKSNCSAKERNHFQGLDNNCHSD